MMGTATASGENAAVVAAGKAMMSPLMEAGGVRGARGVLINITGSSTLGLHEVNEACSLIRNATQNDDVQISFGVVVNEDMGDEVKITVIATGFERDTLPAIQRKERGVHAVAGHGASASAAASHVEPEFDALLEETSGETAGADGAESEMAMAAQANGSPASLIDDLDVPAILRRDRRFVQ
jgi:cell division protein FtsZ